VLASYFVLEEISKLAGKPDMLRRELDKFRARYPDDIEFASLCDIYDLYLASYDEKAFARFRERLRELCSSRKRESAGGGSLPFSDRRTMREDRSKR